MSLATNLGSGKDSRMVMALTIDSIMSRELCKK